MTPLTPQGVCVNSGNITVFRENLVRTVKNVKRMSQKLLIMLGQHAMMKLYNIFAQLSRPFWTNSKVIWRTMVWLLQRIFNGDDYDHCSYRLTNLKSSGAFSAKIFFMGVQSTDYVFLLLNLKDKNMEVDCPYISEGRNSRHMVCATL